MKPVLCIGECMVELAPAGEGLMRRSFAGDVYNTAVYLKRSAPTWPVSFLSVTGDDFLSDELRAAAAGAGLDTRWLFQERGCRPGLYMIRLLEGDRHFSYWRSESPAKYWMSALSRHAPTVLQETALVYLSGISLAILSRDDQDVAIDSLRRAACRVAYDPNVRPALWPSLDRARDCYERMASFVEILLPSRQDLDLLYGPADPETHLRRSGALGQAEIALTCDAAGCLVWHGGEIGSLSQSPVPVVDTTGAGDAFNGAYLAARLRGSLPESAAREGLALASKVVQQPGALISSDGAGSATQ